MNNRRSGNVDIVRFIVSLFIVTFHINCILPTRPFTNLSIYVEFFLIITGYYTSMHFDNKNYDNPMKEGIIYTLRKFIPFLPYTISATILVYLLDRLPKLFSGGLNFKSFLYSFTDDFVFDVSLIISSYSHPLLSPLWYLSTLFIVFPLFSWFVQIHNRYWIISITYLYILYYYGIEFNNPEVGTFNGFYRVVAGLALGVFIYETVTVFSHYLNKINKVFLTIIEIITFLFPVVILFNNIRINRFIIFCFTICLAIMLSGLSYTANINGKVFIYLGRLSMPIYIFHVCIGQFINYFSNKISINTYTKITLYYGGTLVISIVTIYLVDHWKWFQNIIKKSIILKD